MRTTYCVQNRIDRSMIPIVTLDGKPLPTGAKITLHYPDFGRRDFYVATQTSETEALMYRSDEAPGWMLAREKNPEDLLPHFETRAVIPPAPRRPVNPEKVELNMPRMRSLVDSVFEDIAEETAKLAQASLAYAYDSIVEWRGRAKPCDSLLRRPVHGGFPGSTIR